MTLPLPSVIRSLKHREAVLQDTGSSHVGAREIYRLEELVTELELTVRELNEAAHIRELELRSARTEVEVKAAYIAYLETLQATLPADVARLNAQVLAEHAENASLRAQLAELGHLVGTVQRQWSYKFARTFSRIARVTRHPSILLRRLRGVARP